METWDTFFSTSASQVHTFGKAFLGVVGISRDTFKSLVMVCAFLCTMNLRNHSLECD